MSEEFWWIAAPAQLLDRFQASRSLIDVRQAGSGASVLRIYAVYCNSLPFLGNGVSRIDPFILARIVGDAQPGNIAPFPLKPTNSPLPSTVTCGTGRISNDASIFRQITRSLTALTGGAANAFLDSIQDWSFDVPLGLLWGGTRQDSNVQPVVCRAGEGFHLRQTVAAAGTSGNTLEIDMEFSIS